MEIAARRVAVLHFVVFDESGRQHTNTHGHAPLVHMQGSGGIFPGLEEALEGKRAGDRFSLTLPPEKGAGAHLPQLVQTVPLSMYAGMDKPAVGSRLAARNGHGPLQVVVTAVDGDTLTVDGNHPLAGQTFRIDVEVVNVRLATPDELQYGIAGGTRA